MGRKIWSSEDPVLAVFLSFLQVESEGTAAAGVNGSLPIKCRSCKPQASVRPQTGFTGDLETGPLVKSQSSRPEEFRVQETRA